MAVAESQPTEEDAVRKVIETFNQAIDQQDLGRLLAHLTEDAVIDSKIAQGKVNKQTYARALATAFKSYWLIGMDVADMTVRLQDPTRATVVGTIHPRIMARRCSYRHERRLAKRDGRWLIVETSYHPMRAPETLAWPDVV